MGRRSIENRRSDFVVVDVTLDTLDVLRMIKREWKRLRRGRARLCKTI